MQKLWKRTQKFIRIIVANGSRLGEVGDLETQSLKLITNFNK